MSAITREEAAKLQAWLQNKFGNKNITVEIREKAKDSAEVKIAGEFIGTVYKDEEDGDLSYDVNFAILGEDLND
jgi:hypothetical protein